MDITCFPGESRGGHVSTRNCCLGGGRSAGNVGINLPTDHIVEHLAVHRGCRQLAPTTIIRKCPPRRDRRSVGDAVRGHCWSLALVAANMASSTQNAPAIQIERTSLTARSAKCSPCACQTAVTLSSGIVELASASRSTRFASLISCRARLRSRAAFTAAAATILSPSN